MVKVYSATIHRRVVIVHGLMLIAVGLCIAAIELFGGEDTDAPVARIFCLCIAVGLAIYGVRLILRWKDYRIPPPDPMRDNRP